MNTDGRKQMGRSSRYLSGGTEKNDGISQSAGNEKGDGISQSAWWETGPRYEAVAS
jgi:hypothetical protein